MIASVRAFPGSGFVVILPRVPPSPSTPPRPRFPAWAAAAALCIAGGAGCIAPRMAPVNVSEPGWQTTETAVVWRPKAGAPELAGELLLATHPDGRRLVQFSKQALPLVTAQMDARGWRISSSLRSGAWGGRGTPTDRVPWFQIGQLPPVAGGSSRWQLEHRPGPVWHLENPRTGEFVEGVP